MKRYLIKVTYLEGDHKGESYLIKKGGYYTDESHIQWDETTYKTEGICKRVCKHLYEENEINKRWERNDEKIGIKKGRPPKKRYIYESQSYEPYEVEAVDF